MKEVAAQEEFNKKAKKTKYCSHCGKTVPKNHQKKWCRLIQTEGN